MTRQIGAQGRTALIGHTGFVGGALLRQASFSNCYNSTSIAAIDGEHFDMVVCAAAPGSMLEANRAPERDRAQVHALIERLSKLRARRFVLVSSIAVLADFAGGDDEMTSRFQQELAYGRHRRELEAFVEATFPDSLVLRLPALFGRGLRKNFVFDLMNPVPSMLTRARFDALHAALEAGLSGWVADLYAPDEATGMLRLDRLALDRDPRRGALEAAVRELGFCATRFHHRETTYQYYAIDDLWRDIRIATEAGLTHLHLASEPLKAGAIHARLLGREMPETEARLHREDMHSAHAGLWGASGPYLHDAQTTLDRLAAFVADQRMAA
jgi:hypothetical protein